MQLKSLYLHNFRLYKEAFFEFFPQLNMICGQNAAGKTSLIEAIHFLASGYSFRTHQVLNLIRAGTTNLYLEAHFIKHGIEQSLKIFHSGKERKIFLNSTRCASSSSLIGLLLSVVFSPNDIELIKGPPQGRRQFLDAQLAQADPLYLYHTNRYSRAMRQRNCLLKGRNIHTIESWEHEMALSGSYILKKRLQLIAELQPLTTQLYQAIGKEPSPFNLEYRFASKPPEDLTALNRYYLEQYEKHRMREMALAATLVGPHKDDIIISIAGQEARYFASEGQMRSCAAALRLAEWQRLYAITEEKPLMLLDDVATSLDRQRYLRLFEQFDPLGQIFLTATEEPCDFPNRYESKLILL